MIVTRITSLGNNFKFGLQIQNFLATQNDVVTANLASKTDAKADNTFAYTYTESSASLSAIELEMITTSTPIKGKYQITESKYTVVSGSPVSVTVPENSITYIPAYSNCGTRNWCFKIWVIIIHG